MSPPERTSDWWTPGGQLQTLIPTIVGRYLQPLQLPWTRERLHTPDGDFVDVDWVARTTRSHNAECALSPRLILFHGLEGSSSSHYARAFSAEALARGWSVAIPHFRGCSGEMNLAPRAYHAGDFEEVGWLLTQLTRGHTGPTYAIGVSLGGSALLNWAARLPLSKQEEPTVDALCALSAPLDLAACGDAIDSGLNQRIYGQYFLGTMKEKAREKARQFPGLFDLGAVARAMTLREFDDHFTAPVHGFKDVVDYWSRASSGPRLGAVPLRALVINALNDPLVPASSLPSAEDCSPSITLWRPRDGGHVGFGRGGQRAFPRLVLDWLSQAIAQGQAQY